jgi:hypothetical protein
MTYARLLPYGRFHRGGIIQGALLYTMTPWKTPRKSMGEWDYRTRIISVLSSMKLGRSYLKLEYGQGGFIEVGLSRGHSYTQ